MSDVVLEACGVTKQFSGFTAVNNVDLSVRKGAIHALIGPNGAGKSTLFNLLTGFLPVSSGRILMNGNDITKTHPAKISTMGLVRSFQISSIFPKLSVKENVRLALQRKQGYSFHFWKSDQCLSELDDQACDLLGEVGLSDYVHAEASTLPYGRKRALELATTLALDPEIMLLDEPMAGLGQEDVQRIVSLIRAVAQGRTVVMVEHNLKVVADLSDVITVLARGEILAEGTYSDVSQNAEVRAAYMGSSDA